MAIRFQEVFNKPTVQPYIDAFIGRGAKKIGKTITQAEAVLGNTYKELTLLEKTLNKSGLPGKQVVGALSSLPFLEQIRIAVRPVEQKFAARVKEEGLKGNELIQAFKETAQQCLAAIAGLDKEATQSSEPKFLDSLSRSLSQGLNIGVNGNAATGNTNADGLQINNSIIVLPATLTSLKALTEGDKKQPIGTRIAEPLMTDNDILISEDREIIPEHSWNELLEGYIQPVEKKNEAINYLQELKHENEIGVTFALAEDNRSIKIKAPEGKGTRGIYQAIKALAPSNALNDIEIIPGGDTITLQVDDPYSRIDNQNKAETIERVFKQLQNTPALFDNATFQIGDTNTKDTEGLAFLKTLLFPDGAQGLYLADNEIGDNTKCLRIENDFGDQQASILSQIAALGLEGKFERDDLANMNGDTIVLGIRARKGGKSLAEVFGQEFLDKFKPQDSQ